MHISGAGIGGLVCGCYLVKKGLKVLMLEQQNRPGGYCGSFKRNNYTFDMTAHSLGGFRSGGALDTIFNELSLKNRFELIQSDPMSIVIFPEHILNIYKDNNRTLCDLRKKFPDQSQGLVNFFSFIRESTFADVYVTLRNRTLKEWLQLYFTDDLLKCILSSGLVNVGFPSDKASALNFFYQLKEFVFDGGYYPKGGMQKFSNLLAERFIELGGIIYYGKMAKKINITNKKARGVTLENGTMLYSNQIVANCDIYQTFFQMIENKHIPHHIFRLYKNLIPSPSAFIVYLGLNKIETGGDFSNAWNIWYFKDYDIDKVLSRINKNDVNSMTDIIVCSIPSKVDRNPVLEDKDFMLLISLAPYMNYEYWQENRESISDRLINRINNIFKNISSNICIKETATPLTLESYTKNYKGSCFGLGSIVGQIERHVISHRCNFIDGLYIVGHWSTGGAGQGGISFSAASARHVAKLVVQDLKKKKLFLTCQI